jgi:hypothetical protein
MCFSAHASFGAAFVLGAIGVVAIREARRTRAAFSLAAIPMLFAAQQATEGLLWTVLSSAQWGKSDTSLGRVFLFFALALWPAYVPFALWRIEPVMNLARRRVLFASAVIGALLGAYLLGCATFRLSDTCIAFGNLYYWIQIDSAFKGMSPFVYAVLIVGPMILSSRRGTSLLAAATLISFVASGLLHRAGFLSVWCFFAACISGLTVLVVKADALYHHRRSTACEQASLPSSSA